ncbi:MAG: hypothetical protein V1928_01325 [Parcubacteria group bacterium]
MFDDKKTTQPTAQKPEAPASPEFKRGKPQVSNASEEKIFTMPMEYYQGAKPGGVVKAPQAAGSPAGPQSSGGKKKLNILIAVVLILVFAGSVWLLLKSLEKPAANAPVTLAPANNKTAAPVVAAPENNSAAANENSTAPQSAASFDPSALNKFSLSLLSSADSDRDGLTDAEEAIFGTNPQIADKDNDGYPDGHEVQNFYSPISPPLVRLWEEDFVKEYQNAKYNYKLLYPSAWLVKPVSEIVPSDVMIMSDQNEFVNILIDQKMPGQTLADWYLEKAPSVDKTKLKTYATFYKLPVLESPDAFTAYIANNDTIYIVNYSIGLKEEASYPAIFQMIVDSFQFTNVPAVAAPQTESVQP